VNGVQGRASANNAKNAAKISADVVAVILRMVSIAKMCCRARSAVGANLHRGMKAVADAVGTLLVDGFHYLALFAIGATPSGRLPLSSAREASPKRRKVVVTASFRTHRRTGYSTLKRELPGGKL
jgi:hypothetical protein